MAYLREKIDDLKRCLQGWQQSLDLPFSELARDAAIKRFEMSYELLWKSCKLCLQEIHGLEAQSPKMSFRQLKSINPEISESDLERLLTMVSERNLAIHTYSENLANTLYHELPELLKVSKKILKLLEQELE